MSLLTNVNCLEWWGKLLIIMLPEHLPNSSTPVSWILKRVSQVPVHLFSYLLVPQHKDKFPNIRAIGYSVIQYMSHNERN
jgi:hypothetical protein